MSWHEHPLFNNFCDDNIWIIEINARMELSINSKANIDETMDKFSKYFITEKNFKEYLKKKELKNA